jgi:ABC-type histidine transport system ATPase subunit
MDKLPSEISGGMAKRAGIARAMAAAIPTSSSSMNPAPASTPSVPAV